MMEQKYEYNTIEEALEDLRAGRIILVTDDQMCIRDSMKFSAERIEKRIYR